jgi:hypothetical protein
LLSERGGATAEALVPDPADGPALPEELPNRPSVRDPVDAEFVEELAVAEEVKAVEGEAERETTSCSPLGRLSEEMADDRRELSSSGFGG